MEESTNRVNIEDLMIKHRVKISQLIYAGAPSSALWSLSLGHPVDQDHARAVVTALNTLCGTDYGLDDVEALLCCDNEPCYLHRHRIPEFLQRT